MTEHADSVKTYALVFVALIGLVISGRLPRIGRLLTLAGVLGLLVLAVPAVGGGLLVALERDLPLEPLPDQPPQAIVIMSGDISRGNADRPTYEPGPMSLERLRSGAILARQTGLPVLITGGRLRDTDPPLAEVMATSMQSDFKVPVRWVECESRDTGENANFSAPILREQGIRSIYVVSDAWHIRRALLAFADTGIVVTAAPTMLDRAPGGHLTDFVPSVAGWDASYYALHEWIGYIWYAVR